MIDETPQDPAAVLRRWEEFGAFWRVVSSDGPVVTVSLCRCDGGEELERITSSDPALRAYLGARTSSAD